MAEHASDFNDQRALTRRTMTEAGPTADGGPAAHPLLRLQSQVGNAQIARMLAQRAADDDEIAAKHDTSVQRAADDDEIAAKHDTSVQRAADDDEVAAKHDVAQRAADDDEIAAKHDDGEQVGIEGGQVGPDTQSRIQAARGGGSTLDGGVRASMESNFGTSFEDVRVHQNTESDTLNRRLTARAFTTGSDIFLRGDSSPSDTQLLGHELTHVVQQRSGAVSGSGGMSVGAAGDPHEQHADSMGDSVASQSAPPVAAKHEVTQRAADDDEIAAKHDTSVQRAAEEDELAAKHDPSLQRAADDEEMT